MIVCSVCERELPGEAFRKGRQCRACELERARAYRQTEAYRAVKRRYVQSEKGKATIRQREERPEVRAQRLAYSLSPAGRERQRRYTKTEPGRIAARAAVRRYNRTEKGRLKAQEMERRRYHSALRIAARKRHYARWKLTEGARVSRAKQNLKRRLAIGTTDRPLTAAQWLEILNANKHRCFYCKKPGRLTMDHVIPLSKGGEHTKENIVPACPSCNSKKHDKMWLLC